MSDYLVLATLASTLSLVFEMWPQRVPGKLAVMDWKFLELILMKPCVLLVEARLPQPKGDIKTRMSDDAANQRPGSEVVGLAGSLR